MYIIRFLFLNQDLVKSDLWSKVEEWHASVQPELGPEWKAWKQEAMKWFFASLPRVIVKDEEQMNSKISLEEPHTSRKRLKLEIRRPDASVSQAEVPEHQKPSCVNSMNTDSGHGKSEGLIESPLNCTRPAMLALPRVSVTAGNMPDRYNEAALEGEAVELQNTVRSAYERGSKELMVHAPDHSDTSNRYRQCSAFIEAKGRQCGRWANDGDIYCCVHLAFHSVRKRYQIDQTPPVDAPMCEGTTTHGNKCKHRARCGSTFCKKHRFQGNQSSVIADSLSISSVDRSKKKQQMDEDPGNRSMSIATSGQELCLMREAASSSEENLIPIMVEETLDERNCLMNQSELYNALPSAKSNTVEVEHCIGQYGHGNGGECQEFSRRHTLYCEKHLPKFLKRARNGKSRLVSKDVFIYLLKSCTSRRQKLYLHQACELLYAYLKNGLSSQKFVLRADNVAWVLAEASKDFNVGEYLVKLISAEREKLMRLWGLSDDMDRQVSSTETNSLSTMNQESQMTVKCKICAQEFSDDHMLGRHWTEVHKKEARLLFKGYACGICMNLFTNRKVLETHVIEKHGVQFLEHSTLIRCLSCSSHFVSPQKLWQHVFSFHLTELRMPNLNPSNCSSLEDKSVQMKADTTIKLCQNNSVLEKDDSQIYICRFCGLKFDLLPDLGRHHQVAHMSRNPASHFSLKRGNYFIKRSRGGHCRFWKKFGSAFRFKNKKNLLLLKKLHCSSSVSQLKPKLYKQPSEAAGFGELSEYNCCNVAEALFSKMQNTKRRPSGLEILSEARSACCRVSLDAALVVKYGILPENIYLKAAKLCSEMNIQVGWHQEGFVCSRGCMPIKKPYLFAPLKPLPSLAVEPPKIEYRNDGKLEIDECHYILNAEHFNWKPMQKTIVLCEDASFGKEAIPVPCVVDEDLKHVLKLNFNDISCSEESGLALPWKGFIYATQRLINPSLGLDSKSSQLGCACPQPRCCPEKCDHVYLFDNDYDNAVDIHGKSMHGRLPYDDQGRILLEEGYLVYECNSMCSCDTTCKNRVLQRGIQVKLEIFRTEKKGWAVRAGESILRGTFVCEYIGEVQSNAAADRGEQRYDSIGCSYLYDIYAHIDGARCLSEGMIPFVIDATKYGSVSRFINHSCSPNLVNYLVLVESMDCQLAHIGLFANRDIAVGEELAYDYRLKLLPGAGLCCHCEAPNCRGRVC